MRIERICVASHRLDLRYTRCCIASIRRWYPDIPITLLKNEINGAYSTEEIERYWRVDCLPMARRKFRGGLAKLEPLFQPQRQRCFILDSDTVFLGRVLDALEGCDEDFVVNDSGVPEAVESYFFRLALLKEFDPEFEYDGQAFNSGQYLATTGLLAREDFAHLLTDAEPQEIRYPAIFGGTDQGILNYVVLKKRQLGRLTLATRHLMWWAGEPTLRIDPGRLDDGDAYPLILHWAGTKHALFRRMRQSTVLDHYERLYYARIPGGRFRRLQAIAFETIRSTRLLQSLRVRSGRLRTRPLASYKGWRRRGARLLRAAHFRIKQ